MHTRVLLIAWIACIGISCDKPGSTSDCITGGVTTPNTYRFWTSMPITNITIEVTTQNGSNMASFYYVVKMYYPNPAAGWEPDPCTYNVNMEAVFELAKGERYTWKATKGSQTWTGTINVPCEQGKCFNARIQ